MGVLKDDVARFNYIKVAWRVLNSNLLGFIGLEDRPVWNDLEISGIRALYINYHFLSSWIFEIDKIGRAHV